MTDLLSGMVQMSIDTPSVFIPHIKSGNLKGLAISGDRRNAALPEVPTLTEAGLPGFSATNWYTLLAPAATPRDVIEKLNGYVARAQATPEVQEQLAKQGIAVFPNSVTATNALMRSELENFGKVIRANNIKAEPED